MVLEFTSKNDTGNGSPSAIPREIFDAVSIMGDKPKSPIVTNTNENEKTKAPPTRSVTSPFLDSSHEEKDSVFTDFTTTEPVKVTFSAPTSVIPNKKPVATVVGQAGIANIVPPVDSRLHFAFRDQAMSAKASHTWLYFGIAVTALFAGAGIGWYFFRTKLPFYSQPVVVLDPIQLVAPTQPVNIKQLPFSLDRANYLFLDTESATPASIKQVLDQAGKTIIEANIAVPVEFLLTDKNNNPLAFSRLAYLEKITLPADLLSVLDEPFSVFLYNDEGMIHLGLMLTLKETASGNILIKNNEATLPLSFQNLFYGDAALPHKAVFHAGVYGTHAIRYVNIALDKNVSFDYVLEEKQWLIGNSRNALRVLLDKNYGQPQT